MCGHLLFQFILTFFVVNYLDKTAKKGVTYKYSVKAYSGSTKSANNTNGLSVKDKY